MLALFNRIQQNKKQQQDFEKTLRSFDDSNINDHTEKVRKYSFNNLFAKVFTKICDNIVTG